MMFAKLLSPDASPNSTPREALRSAVELLSPWFWFGVGEQRHVAELHRYFAESFSTPHVFSFSHGRTALTAILHSLGVTQKDDVFLQAFTCVVVPNSIMTIDAQPVYVDVDATYNMDPVDLEKKIQSSARPRAVIIQHTFGVPADIENIQALCKKYNLFLIEDCAHSMFATCKGKLVGTFGDAALFSFGRDKCVSGVTGGVAVLKNDLHADAMQEYVALLALPSRAWIAQHLAHTLLFEVGKALFRVHPKLYTAWITVWKKIGVLPLVVTSDEKKGVASKGYILPPELAHRALLQLNDIHRLHAHREELTALYENLLGSAYTPQMLRADASSALLRYTIHHPDMPRIERALKKEGVYLGRWYDTIVAPKDTDLASIEYVPGSCPAAELLTQGIANLPTHRGITRDDAERIAQLIRSVTTSV